MNSRSRLFALLLAGATLAGCQHHPPKPEATIPSEESPTMDHGYQQLPTLKDSIPPMLDLIDAIRREISRQVPATVPWSWSGKFDSSPCVGQGGTKLSFPSLYSEHAFSEPEWAQVLPAVTRLATDAGFTGGSEGPMNKAGNHDVNFDSSDGRSLRFGTRYATLVTAYVGCRLTGDQLWGDDGRIPMPPDPQP